LNKHLWEVGFFKDVGLSKDDFLQLQTQGYIRYENLPLETKDGKKVEVEFVSNVYQAGGRKVIQCNIRDISERRKTEDALLYKTMLLEAQRKHPLTEYWLLTMKGAPFFQQAFQRIVADPPADPGHERRCQDIGIRFETTK